MAAQDFKDEVEEVQQVMAARTDRLPSRARGPTVTFGRAGLTCGLAEMRSTLPATILWQWVAERVREEVS